ncbi:hypothetical protein M9H77_30168 [Catharanthus roseus]|uniref:Uncharacterized protein n=1 Tax=Catharanthus roseus TaxID=4058 RepID=A0ACC0A0E1_CATRO|nr:hypothetical protein M9H77_30168 [Catharanthus roseus]
MKPNMRFERDLKWRTEVEIVPLYCSNKNNFTITKCALKEAYELATRLNLRVKGVFMTNPSNPLGTTITLDEFNLLITYAISKNIHIVSDEIYMLEQSSIPHLSQVSLKP